MRRVTRLTWAVFAALCVAQAARAGAPTTIADFFLPGSQPLESGQIMDADGCNCHSGYDKHVEPEFTWRGGMMSQAMRDPLFQASMVIANQDAPESGDLCLRCHTPKGWLEGRSLPTDGSSLQGADLDGVLCHFCHKMVKPTPLGVNPYPGDAAYAATTYGPDQAYLGTLSALPAHSADGMYIADAADFRRGPYADVQPPHDFYYAPFFRDASLCGTCHDVSNPVFTRASDGRYVPNSFGSPSPNFDPLTMFPVERTFSEWKVSAYNTAAGVYAPQFGGNLDTVRTCQDCHMRDATGRAAKKGSAPTRDDLGIHDLTGGNTFVPELIKTSFAGTVNAEALDSGIVRARSMLELAATVDLSVMPQGPGFAATVTVTNQTAHKLPSGYPEGRRLWINLRAYNSSGSLIYESGAYDTGTAILTHDSGAKIYEIKPGISPTLASVVGETTGPSFHFVLNDTIYKDNRIPPRGFTNARFDSIQSPPVAYSYTDGQYWDVTTYSVPGATARVTATLYYQTVSKEYIEFLRDENVTDQTGDSLFALWSSHGKSRPVAMARDSASVTPTGDTDGDGVPDSLDNCPAIANPAQTDTDQDGFGTACDCNDLDSLIHPNTVWYADADSDSYGDTATTLIQCVQPAGYVLDSTDCDDTDPDIHPRASEICNGSDDNCSGTSDEGLGDSDVDGWGAACDNCSEVFNPGQGDSDANGIGDACDVIECPVVITGDVNLTGDITSSDIIRLVNYAFKGGQSPEPCEAAGDVNCSAAVTSADIISLVGYVFKGGLPPCDVCGLIPSTWSCP